jgi:phage N-6-adenine-methyltransferase
MNDVHFSSKSNEWETPADLFAVYDAEFNFTLDAAATFENAKCNRFFTIRENGLAQSWQGETVWLNPPYGRQIGKWIEKAYHEAQNGATVVCLIPARTDTRYFHDFCFKGEVRFLKGRVYFTQNGNGADRAPFPSAIVVFRKENILSNYQSGQPIC